RLKPDHPFERMGYRILRLKVVRMRQLCFLLMALAWHVWPAAHGSEPPGPPKDTLPPAFSITDIPLGLAASRPVPKDNPLTEAKVRLGRRLFFDPILSTDGTVS